VQPPAPQQPAAKIQRCCARPGSWILDAILLLLLLLRCCCCCWLAAAAGLLLLLLVSSRSWLAGGWLLAGCCCWPFAAVGVESLLAGWRLAAGWLAQNRVRIQCVYVLQLWIWEPSIISLADSTADRGRCMLLSIWPERLWNKTESTICCGKNFSWAGPNLQNINQLSWFPRSILKVFLLNSPMTRNPGKSSAQDFGLVGEGFFLIRTRFGKEFPILLR
jgi:hypothetical protein